MTAKSLFERRRWLVSGLALAGVWLAFRCAIVPSQEREDHVRTEVASLRQRISDARATIKEIQELEMESSSARSELYRLDNEFPASPPVVWIPEQIRHHFARSGFAKLEIRMKTALDEPELPGYQRTSWSMEIPVQNVTGQVDNLLLAVADLDEKKRIFRVADIAIEANAQESGPRTAVVNFSALARK